MGLHFLEDEEKEMRTVTVSIVGSMPLLMHADNIDWSDRMEAWKNDPKNRSMSKAGDDRTPPWRWLGCLNYDDPKTGIVTIPSEYVMRAIMGGAAEVPTGKGKKTFKAQSQSGLLCRDFHWPLLIDGEPIQMAKVNECLRLEEGFSAQKEAAKALGFSLMVKRAKIGASKHVRVRPLFERWSTHGDIIIVDQQITIEVLKQILEYAGKLKGFGDWRPGAPTPGPFGMFTATVE